VGARSSSGPGVQKHFRFQTFNDPQLMEMVSLSGLFAQNVVNRCRPRHWLSLLGSSGTGKTHLANVLWNKLQEPAGCGRGEYLERFIYWPAFVEELRQTAKDGNGIKFFLSMERWPLLVLDDIGAERDPSGFGVDKLNTLLNLRVGRWTILTSNLGLDALAKLDTRIASRIIREPGNLFIEATTTDYGLRKHADTRKAA
jgi:DNA replication protein DnaC